MIRNLIIVCVMLILFEGCKSKAAVSTDGLHFTLLSSNETHIDFNNQITESDSINVFQNEYMYNGSGVGIGDFNGDGLPDIFFGGSMVSSKLYINKGNFTFEDVTQKAGLGTAQWCTGVNIIDINNDGFPDIYICSSHSHNPQKRKNLLFINDGHLHFAEQAAAYGLADTGYSTQAAFLDYDKDGDLDMYLLNHRLYDNTANNLMPKDTSGASPAQDRLYRNNGIPAGQSHPHFVDVSTEAGIKDDGYGLGVVVTDVNNDNWPDVYVANDYIGNDQLWLNNKNGSFTNGIATALRHQSYNSMGVDAADINNDGLQDLAVVDMMPENNERKKMMFSATSQEKYDMQQRMGYEPAFVRNMLQLNNGVRKNNTAWEPFYSEIGQLAGISETDWSWSILMADFDNDGWKDVHITNGLAKDVTNNDYAAFRNGHASGNYTFSSNIQAIQPLDKSTEKTLREHLDEYGSVKINNYFFHNNGNLTFCNETEATGLGNPSISHGADYADLDNDGDLDLVVNNMNGEAFVYRNEVRKSVTDATHNFIAIQLKGSSTNLSAIGSKITLFNKGTIQLLEQSPVRGYCSSVDYTLHFGVGNVSFIDSLQIQWPDNKTQTVRNVKANQLLTLRYTDAKNNDATQEKSATATLFYEVSNEYHIDFAHIESQYYDYGSQRGLLQKYSQLGPCIATGDLNGDGLEDFFVGGAAYQSGKLFFQNGDGTFSAKNLVAERKQEEDLAVNFLDADGDKDLDLLISGGSIEFGQNSPNNFSRLYSNDGRGNFTLNTSALPQLSLISKAVSVADYDGDGDMDIFMGGYVLPQAYPQSPRSYLLQNNKGVFTDVTRQVCPLLQTPGMITDALWTDFNGDKRPDLIICGEWMPIRFFQNTGGQLKEITTTTGMNIGKGMWRGLQEVDIDKDGDMDYVAGNMGLNNRYHVTPQKPMMLYAKDIDKNGSEDLIPAYFIKDKDAAYKLFPGADRNQLADRFPGIKKKYLLHKEFAGTTMEKLTNDIGPEDWIKLTCETMQTVWIENKGNGKFISHALPIEAQFAPVNAIVPFDVDKDGNIDLIIAGNEYEADAMIGRYDASYGLVLKGDGRANFNPVNIMKSGFIVDGDVKDMKVVNVKRTGEVVIASVNNNKVKYFALSKKN